MKQGKWQKRKKLNNLWTIKTREWFSDSSAKRILPFNKTHWWQVKRKQECIYNPSSQYWCTKVLTTVCMSRNGFLQCTNHSNCIIFKFEDIIVKPYSLEGSWIMLLISQFHLSFFEVRSKYLLYLQKCKNYWKFLAKNSVY